MSPQEQLDFDFWEFVSCAKCRMPFALDNGAPTVPFWLTECGHVVCNSHLNPDQSCSQCGSRDIQLAPLQREMEAPMSDWFHPIPQALDSISYAVKFQQDALASQLRYYRSRQQYFRQIFERIKKEQSDLKKENEALRRENDHLRLQLSQQGDDGYIINTNGKRQVTSAHDRSRILPSSRIHTPIGPNRLTLQPGQPVPELSHDEQNSRPLSSLSLDQYAYKSPDGQRYTPPTLTHAQSAPRAFQGFQPQSRVQRDVSQTSSNDAIPSSSRFKPAGMTPPVSSRNNPTGQFNRHPANMGPPPTPQHHAHQTTNISGRASNPTSYFPPASRQQVSMPSTSSGQRPMASASTPQRFFQNGILPSGSRMGVTRPNNLPMTNGQMLPFINIPALK